MQKHSGGPYRAQRTTGVKDADPPPPSLRDSFWAAAAASGARLTSGGGLKRKALDPCQSGASQGRGLLASRTTGARSGGRGTSSAKPPECFLGGGGFVRASDIGRWSKTERTRPLSIRSVARTRSATCSSKRRIRRRHARALGLPVSRATGRWRSSAAV